MSGNFYGRAGATVPAINDEYPGIKTPVDLYEALSDIWCVKNGRRKIKRSASARLLHFWRRIFSAEK